MGQRFQSVFILPSVFMNENNSNNRDRKVLVFHNQWLYGYSALDLNLRIMNRIKKGISSRAKMGSYAKTKKDYINHYLERAVNNAVRFCFLENLHSESNFHDPTEFIFKDYEDLGNELTKEDNNNGFFICEIDNKLNLSYAFMSGLEDEETINFKFPEQYLKLFYKDEDIIKFDPKLKKRIKKVLSELNKFKPFPLLDLFKVIEVLNKNKPSWATG